MTIIIIAVTKHLGGEGLLCWDYQNGIIDEEENIILVTEPKLFSIGTINLHEIIQLVKTINKRGDYGYYCKN